MRCLSFSRTIAQNSWTSLIIYEALAWAIQTLRPCQLRLVTKKMQGKHFPAFSKIYLISLVLFANYSIGLMTDIYQILSISYDSAGDRNKGMFLAT